MEDENVPFSGKGSQDILVETESQPIFAALMSRRNMLHWLTRTLLHRDD